MTNLKVQSIPMELGDDLTRRANALRVRDRTREPALRLAKRLVRLRELFQVAHLGALAMGSLDEATRLRELARFLVDRELASRPSALEALEWWIDYCEAAVVASTMGNKYRDSVSESAYTLENIELHKRASPSAKLREAVAADFGIENSSNWIGNYHWKAAPGPSIDIIGEGVLKKPIVLRVVKTLSPLHLLGSVASVTRTVGGQTETRKLFDPHDVDFLGPTLTLQAARVAWPVSCEAQDVLVVTVAERIPGSKWHMAGTTPLTGTLKTYFKWAHYMLDPPGSLREADLEGKRITWFADDLDVLFGIDRPVMDRLPMALTFSQGNPSSYFAKSKNDFSYAFTRNAIVYFAANNLVPPPPGFQVPPGWKPLELIKSVEAARAACEAKLEAATTKGGEWEQWNQKRDALREAWLACKKQLDPGLRPNMLEGVRKAAESATEAWTNLKMMAEGWDRSEAERLREALRAWNQFIQHDMTTYPAIPAADEPWRNPDYWNENWMILRAGRLLKNPAARIHEGVVVLFHFHGRDDGRDVLIRGEYHHMYDLALPEKVSDRLDASALDTFKLGSCGAVGWSIGPHLHVTTQWCDVDRADAEACMNAKDPTGLADWIDPLKKQWRPMPPAFLFPKKVAR